MADLVTLAEAKSFLGLELTQDDDSLLAELIDYATKAVESYTGRSFTSTASLSEKVDGGGECLVLGTPPANIASITDSDGNAFDLTLIDTDADAGLIYQIDGSLWYGGRRAWTVVYTGGYAAVPNDVKLATLTCIAELHENRTGVKGESLGDHRVDYSAIPDRVKALLESYRRILI